MARVRPFAGWRYAHTATDISALVAPPYDVISPDLRSSLIARDPHNVVALELPDGALDPSVPDNRYEQGKKTWDQWRAESVLAQDRRPMVYALEQSHELEGALVRRRAFVLEVGLEPFSAGVVLPHERTLPKALGDRFELTRATRANLSQVLGLFDDPDGGATALLDASMTGEPVAEATDDDGVCSRLWACDDGQVASEISSLLADARIFIADGHHRYTTALAYRDLRRTEAGEDLSAGPGEADYDYVMMALVSMEDPDLVVLPTHRVADAPATFDADAFKRSLSEHFVLETGGTDALLADPDKPGFLVKTRADVEPLLARLRPDVDPATAIRAQASDAWKRLDVAILQELVLDPLLDIHPDRAETLERLTFVKDTNAALALAGQHDVAFVLKPTRVEQLRAVALAGETMPQKSTYFYPKLLSGLVFRSAE